VHRVDLALHAGEVLSLPDARAVPAAVPLGRATDTDLPVVAITSDRVRP